MQVTEVKRYIPFQQENFILARCPELKSLKTCRTFQFPQKKFLHLAEEQLSSIYFVRCGVISHMIEMEDGRSVEIGLTGPEGVVGIEGALGLPTLGSSQVQCPVSGIQVDAADLQKSLTNDSSTFQLFSHFATVMQRQTAQTAACNRLHHVAERLARWLLMVDDRVSLDTLPLTQELMGHVLGTRRSEVNIASRDFVRKGLIRQQRARISILDRSGLEQESCECYGVLRQENERWLATLGITERLAG